MTTTESLLLHRLDELTAEIISLSRDGKRTQHLLSQRDLTARLVATATDLPKENRYSHFLKPIQAVMGILEERGRPMPEDEIVEALVEGGWLGGNKRAALTLHKSIKIHTHGTGAQTHQIKHVNGLIGLYAWDHILFVSRPAA